MPRLTALAALSAFLCTALPAAAAGAGHWGDRAAPRDPAVHLVDKKLDKGKRSGALDTKELKQLVGQRQQLVKMKRSALRDGVLTRIEYKRIRAEEDELLRAIDRASVDKRGARLGPQQQPLVLQHGKLAPRR
jgi:hypothetical protein